MGKIDVAVHTWNLSTWEAEQEDHEFKVSLGYTVRPCLKKKKKKKERKIKPMKRINMGRSFEQTQEKKRPKRQISKRYENR
jgi:hypothetical protein